MASPVATILAKAPAAIGVAKAAYKLYKNKGAKATAEEYGRKITKYLKDEFPELAGPPARVRKAVDRQTDLPKEKAYVEPKSTAAKAGRRPGDYLKKSEGTARDATARAARRSAATEFLNPREKVKASKSKPFTGKDNNNEGTIDAAQVKRAAKDVGLPFRRGGSPMRKKAKR